MKTAQKDQDTFNKVKIHRLVVMCFYVLIMSITACTNSNVSHNGKIFPATGIPLPSVVALTTLPATGTKSAAIYMDNSTTPLATQVLSASATEAAFQLTVPAGEHTFKIEFRYNDATWGEFILASATSAPINVGAGSSQTISFADADYLPLPDDDNDGIANIVELAAGTDPSNADIDPPSANATPVGNVYSSTQTVSLSCVDNTGGSGCNSIFYSFDAAAPLDQYSIYNASLSISQNTSLVFFAVDNAGNKGTIAQESYQIDTAPPVTSASPPGASYIGSQLVKLICNDGSGAGCKATYYTTDGSTPTTSSILYTQPISVTGNTTLRFMSIDNFDHPETPVRQDYFISGFTKTVAPDISTTGGGAFNTDAYIHQQILYRAEDIKGTGYIYSIKLRYNSDVASDVNCPNTTIKLGQTTVTDLASDYAMNVEQGAGSLLTVFSGTLTLNAASAGETTEIILNSPYNYNGVENLVLDIERTNACSAIVDLRNESSIPYTSLLTTNTPAATTGTPSSLLYHTKFVFSGGDDNIVYPGSPNSNSFPFTIGSNKVQQLYFASDLDGAGVLTGIGFRVNAVTTQQSYSVSVKVGHTQLTDLTTTFADNYSTPPVTVANAVSFTVPLGLPVGSYIWVPFTANNAFEYNGIDNLVVEIELTSPTGTTWLSYIPIANNVRVYGATGATTGTVDGYGYFAKLRFAGGPINVISNGSAILDWPFTTFSTRSQFLYDAALLGSSGTISGIRLRLANDALANSYNPWQIIIGHTTLLSLAAGNLFSSTMLDATTVTVGTLNMPSSLLNGDWIDLPFITPFPYDGAHNLVIELSSTGGTVINTYRASNGAGDVSLNRHMTVPSNTTDTSDAANDNVADIQILFQ